MTADKGRELFTAGILSLWEMENVLLQPHISAASPQYLELFVRELAGRINSGELG